MDVLFFTVLTLLGLGFFWLFYKSINAFDKI
jgi:hypothetical protein